MRNAAKVQETESSADTLCRSLPVTCMKITGGCAVLEAYQTPPGPKMRLFTMYGAECPLGPPSIPLTLYPISYGKMKAIHVQARRRTECFSKYPSLPFHWLSYDL